MAVLDLDSMTYGELREYVEHLEEQVIECTKKLDNTKKLDRRQADRVRSMWATRRWNMTELAHAFDVNRSTISRIISGDYYA